VWHEITLGKKNEVLKYMTRKEMRKAREKVSSHRQPEELRTQLDEHGPPLVAI